MARGDRRIAAVPRGLLQRGGAVLAAGATQVRPSASVVRLPRDAGAARADVLAPAVEALPGRVDPARREGPESPRKALA